LDRQDPKTYATINEVRYAPDGNHLIINAIAADTSVVEFKVQVSAGRIRLLNHARQGYCDPRPSEYGGYPGLVQPSRTCPPLMRC
jgi:hypothetical protein